MKNYTIFAGVNGAGKTSIYRSIYYKENKLEKRINTDEMVARIGSWKDNNIQLKCAREAVKLINRYIADGISFNQETTLCGKSIIRNINLAKENGFHITMNYIGVESPEIAKERVLLRVKKGGHGIPDDAIERRYGDSLLNLNKVISMCDKINIYDNTEMFRLVMVFDNGEMIWKDKKIPGWLKNNINYERERSLHERANMISSAEERKAVEIARNLLNMNIPLEQVVLATGLTEEEINKIR